MTAYQAVASTAGWTVDLDEAIEHLSQHDQDDAACADCPEEVRVATATALPNEDGKLPGSYRTVHVLVEHDDLHFLEVDEAIARLRQARQISNALNATETAQ